MGHHHDHSHEEHSHEEHSHEGHSHAGHSHADASTPSRKLWLAFFLTAGFMVVEVVYGFLSGSLALLSDAGHMLTDAGALALALFAQRVADKPRTRRYTFGFRRAEILAALINGTALGASAVWVVVEAIRRLDAPPDVKGRSMFVVATLGLAINLLTAWILSRGTNKNANVRAALAHVLSDAAGSVAAMVAALLLLFFDLRRADPIASIAISLLILWGAWRLVRESTRTLMETTPEGVDVAALEATIRETPGVTEVHDLHVWAISDGFPVVSAHVMLDGKSHGVDVVRRVGDRLRAKHHIEHATIQPEAPPEDFVPASRLRRVK